jgi:excisionase family DNA binding protein
MDDLLTTRQVQERLKVDRITVYRMLNDGRLKGVKIGQQWRFPRREVERMLGQAEPPAPAAPAASDATFPTHCVQTIQNLFSEIGQVSAVMVDMQGNPLTQISGPCAVCPMLRSSPQGAAACRESWQTFARQSAAGGRYFTCHAGLQYTGTPIYDRGEQIGLFLAGQFYWQTPNPEEESARVEQLAAAHQLPVGALQEAARAIPVIPPDLHARVQAWPATAAHAIHSILHERTGFVSRLQQIASLTQIG